MLQPGDQVGRFEIQRRLGLGGMGTVYVAHDPKLGRMVALKVFHGDMDLADAADRFAREARAAAALNHPNIVTIHDFGEYNSQPYIVMEYVPGETLTQIIRRKEPLRLSDKLRYIDNLAFAVSYAHGVGIIHRDIKPTNLMVDRSGRLKVLDFGIARILGTLGSNATALIGTPGYMAPEQILGGSIDARSDLFSIGVVSYELLSYTDAFPGETIPTITHRILTQEPSPLGQVIPGLPPELIAVIEKAIKKKADERFDDVESFRAAIGSLRPQIDDDPPLSWLPTTIRSGPPSAAARFGTGSVKQPIVDSVAALTPPPAPESSRQNREHILRRRTERIEAALADSKSAFERGELDVALDACFQALTLDDTHVGALNLEQSIQNAIARRRANTLLEEARGHLDVGALTSAHDLLQQARSLNPEAPDVKLLERDLRLARAEQERLRQRGNTVKGAVDAATQALHRGELETALAFARQALELDPTCVPAKAIEAQALQKIDEEIGSVTPSAVVALAPSLGMASTAADSAATVIASRPVTPLPAKRMVAPKPVPDEKGPSAKATGKIPKALPSARKQQRRSLKEIAAPTVTLVSSAIVKFRARPKRDKMIVGGAAAAVLLLVAIGVGVMTVSSAPAIGTVLIDAVPWAKIVDIQAQDGTHPVLPANSVTPMSMTLPAATYKIRLVGPPPEGEARIVTVQVMANGAVSSPAEHFNSMTPEEYFDQYLRGPADASSSPDFGAASSATTAVKTSSAAPVSPGPGAQEPPR